MQGTGGIDPGGTFVHQLAYDTVRSNLRAADAPRFGWPGPEGHRLCKFKTFAMTGLIIENLSHAYGGKTVVDSVDLTVIEGEIQCLVGPSGCGKSTTLRVAAGLEPLQQGRVIIDDAVVASAKISLAPEYRRVGLVFQDYALFPHLTVLENVAFGLADRSMEQQRKEAERALTQVRLTTQADMYPHMLSGGQQQRVALARALAPRPFAILLDEPFSNLDFKLRRQVWEDTLSVLREAGTPTLLVTHDPHEAMKMADRVAVMEEGAILQVGTPSEIYSQPKTASIARFFGETTTMDCDVRNGVVATPFVDIPANGASDGSRVEVVIRPEAFQLNIGHEGHAACEHNVCEVDATVVDARHLGPYSLVRFTVGDDKTVLVSRAPGLLSPLPGQHIRVHLDPSGAFVFSKETLGKEPTA